jgi:hypothetical protein
MGCVLSRPILPSEALQKCKAAAECCVCMKVMRNPTTCQPCWHTFCEHCLLQWADATLATRAADEPPNCPFCHARIKSVGAVRALRELCTALTPEPADARKTLSIYRTKVNYRSPHWIAVAFVRSGAQGGLHFAQSIGVAMARQLDHDVGHARDLRGRHDRRRLDRRLLAAPHAHVARAVAAADAPGLGGVRDLVDRAGIDGQAALVVRAARAHRPAVELVVMIDQLLPRPELHRSRDSRT